MSLIQNTWRGIIGRDVYETGRGLLQIAMVFCAFAFLWSAMVPQYHEASSLAAGAIGTAVSIILKKFSLF